MFPTTLQHPYAPRGRRRGRNDPNSRDYICPCGKSYLSYPALFTHIKIKHNGRAPGQIIKPKSENVSKRGRPRQKQLHDSESDTNDIAANCIDRLCDFVSDYQKPQTFPISLLKQLYMKDPFYRIYVDYNPQQQQIRYNQRQDLYEQYCDNVFCEMIAEFNKRVNQPFYVDEVIVFFMMFSSCINEVMLKGGKVEGFEVYEQGGEEENLHENDQQQNQEDNQELYKQDQGEEHQQDQEDQQDYNQQQEKNKNKQNKQNQQYQQILEEQQQIANPNYPLQQKQQQQNVLQQQQQQQQQQNDYYSSKSKHQLIRNIVNFVNLFVLKFYPKYRQEYGLEGLAFFQPENINKFLQLLFNWLTIKKYICYKVKINQRFSSIPQKSNE